MQFLSVASPVPDLASSPGGQPSGPNKLQQAGKAPAPAVPLFPGLRRGSASEPLARLSSGCPAVDALLGGGWPRGRISELCGPRSSGRTALALHTAATVTRSGGFVAWVDGADTLSPLSLAWSGAILSQIYWVRPPDFRVSLRCAELLLQSTGFSLLVLDCGDTPPRLSSSAPWIRLQRAAEQAGAALLLLSPRALAGSFTALRLRLERRRPYWQGGAWPLFLGWESTGVIERNKLGREGKRLLLPVRTFERLTPGGA